jgi:hypothetical protein
VTNKVSHVTTADLLQVQSLSHFESSAATAFNAPKKAPRTTLMSRLEAQAHSSTSPALSRVSASRSISSPALSSREPSSDGFTANVDLTLAGGHVKKRKKISSRSITTTTSSNNFNSDGESEVERPKKKTKNSSKSRDRRKKVESEESEEVEVVDDAVAGRGKHRVGDDPSLLSFYPPDIRKLMTISNNDLCARLMTLDPFADEDTSIAEAKNAWRRTMTSHNRNTEIAAGQIKNVSLNYVLKSKYDLRFILGTC